MGIISVIPPTERDPGPYPAGRACPCGTILSRYNPGPFCAPCQPPVAKEQADELIRELMEESA